MAASKVGGQYDLYPAGELVALLTGYTGTATILAEFAVRRDLLRSEELLMIQHSVKLSVKIVLISFPFSCTHVCSEYGLVRFLDVSSGISRYGSLKGWEVESNGG